MLYALSGKLPEELNKIKSMTELLIHRILSRLYTVYNKAKEHQIEEKEYSIIPALVRAAKINQNIDMLKQKTNFDALSINFRLESDESEFLIDPNNDEEKWHEISLDKYTTNIKITISFEKIVYG